MSDHITLSLGALPWEPTAETEFIEELDRWNQPTLGILRQHGAYFLFDALVNSDSAPTIWVYSPLSASELSEYETAGPQDIDRLVRQHQSNRNLTVAITGDDGRIFVGRGVTAEDLPVDEVERRGALLSTMAAHLAEILRLSTGPETPEGRRPPESEILLQLIPH